MGEGVGALAGPGIRRRLYLAGAGAVGGGLIGYTQSGDLTPGWESGLVAGGGSLLGTAVMLGGAWGLDHLRGGEDAAARADAVTSAVVDRLPLTLPPITQVRASVALDPDRQVAPSRGRRRVLEQLQAWCDDETGPAVGILSGPIGVGKTRVTVRLAEQLAPAWTVGRLRRGAGAAGIAELRSTRRKVLVVVEAPWAVTDLDAVLDEAYRDQSRNVRLLLVTRNRLWLDAMTASGHARDCLADAMTIELSPEGSSADELARWFDEARHAYQGLSPGGAAGSPGGRLAAGHTWGEIQALAFAAAAGAIADRGASLADVVEALADHEREHRPAPPAGLASEVADAAVAVLLLRCPDGIEAAEGILKRLPDLSDASAERVREVARWVVGAYPGTAEGSVAQPDPPLIGYGLIVPTLSRSPAACAAAFDDLDLVAAAQAVAFLLNATAYLPGAGALVTEAVARIPSSGRVPDLSWLGALAGSASIDHVLAELVPRINLGLEELAALRQRLPSVRAPYAVLASWQSTVALLRPLAETDPAVYAGNLAVAVRNLGAGLTQVGRHQEALTMHEEAVTLLRALAQTDPAVHTGDLATAVRNLGVGLSQVGRHQEALTMHEEAVTLFRALAQTDPAVYASYLAQAERSLRDHAAARDESSTAELGLPSPHIDVTDPVRSQADPPPAR